MIFIFILFFYQHIIGYMYIYILDTHIGSVPDFRIDLKYIELINTFKWIRISCKLYGSSYKKKLNIHEIIYLISVHWHFDKISNFMF